MNTRDLVPLELGVEIHLDDIKAAFFTARRALCKVALCRTHDVTLLFSVNGRSGLRQSRFGVGVESPRFDLNKGEVLAVFYDQIDLAAERAKVSFNDPIAVFSKKPCGGRLAVVASDATKSKSLHSSRNFKKERR